MERVVVGGGGGWEGGVAVFGLIFSGYVLQAS